MTSFKQWNSGDVLVAVDQNGDLVKCPVGGNYKMITGRTTWTATTSSNPYPSGLTISWGYTFTTVLSVQAFLECSAAGWQKWILNQFGAPGASSGNFIIQTADASAQSQSGHINWTVVGT